MKTITTPWIEIFRGGWQTDGSGKKKYWDAAKLDKLIEKIDNVQLIAPAVVGHPDMNSPAYGWVQKAKRVGLKIYAIFTQVDPKFWAAVKAGRYKEAVDSGR